MTESAGDLPKKENRRISTLLTRRGGLIFLLIILLVTFGTFTYAYQQATNQVKEETRHELITAATLIAARVDGDRVAALSPGDEGTPEFIALRDELARARDEVPSIRFAYIMREEADRVVFVVDADYGTAPDAAKIGQVYPDPPPDMREGFVRPSADRDFTTDQWGSVLSGYAPVRADDGTVTGLVGVDMDQSLVVERSRFMGWTAFFGVFAIILIAAGGVVYFERLRGKKDRELEASVERYRAFFSTSRDSVFITSKEGGWIDVNKAAVSLFGYRDREELMKTPVIDIYADPEERARHLSVIDSRGYSVEYPVLLQKKDGTRIHAQITSVAKRDGTGKITGYQGIIRDVTAEVHAREALENSELRYRTFIDSMNDMAFLKDPDHRYVVANAELQRFFGLPEAGIVGKTDFQLMEEGAAEKCVASDNEALVSEKPVITEERAGDRIFETRKFLVRPEHGTIFIGGYIRDVTESRNAELAMQESEEKFRELFNNAGDVIFLHELNAWDAPGRFIEVNRVACERLGYSREEFLTMTPEDIDAPGTRDHVPAVMRELAKNGHATFEGVHVKKSGEQVPVEISAHIFEFRGRKVVLSIVRDITERKIFQEKLAESLDQISRNMVQFAVLNDQIRNPLQVIMGEMMLDREPDRNRILDQIAKIDGLISRLDRGYLESEKVREFLQRHYGLKGERKDR
ncbi:PAS domain S-box-containing protein [Methanolinea mesophila]|uniref:PAS domain S-box protein n=1 Tax=Methanolinea mesophila TaxID=547055 RepID=UPI001AE61E82|nr:PAS domain S-box protein [Methanolinea mesophila]MBP1928721.1 PAS domain S-box-containing protein [Methanolinea mesophila]